MRLGAPNPPMVRPESHRQLTGASPVMELPEGHVAGVQCIWVTGCAEATYPPAKGVQTSSP
jgi:hypothetical protein